MTTTPIYQSVVRELGWSPDELSEPFDLPAILMRSRVDAELKLRPWLVPLVPLDPVQPELAEPEPELPELGDE